ncbi:MAG: DUF2970 domain-containing protein [Betaproteobacteria bacterium]|nr:DUF2970 domain-containing protein [Betaproteobacteria bacterium]
MKASPLQLLRMVLSAFLGIRRKGDDQQAQVTPIQIIVVAVIAAALFVVGIVTVVRLVTG